MKVRVTLVVTLLFCLGALVNCSKNEQFRVEDSPVHSLIYGVIHFTGDSVSPAELEELSEVSGFNLSQITRNSATADGRLFFEIINADKLSADQFASGLQAINNLSFVSDARFEPVVRPATN